MCVYVPEKERETKQTESKMRQLKWNISYMLKQRSFSITGQFWTHSDITQDLATLQERHTPITVARALGGNHLTLKREQAESTTTQTRKRVRACLYTGLTFKNEDENRKKIPRNEQCMRKEVYILLWANAKVYNYINSCFVFFFKKHWGHLIEMMQRNDAWSINPSPPHTSHT